jgi:hypothetical protein
MVRDPREDSGAADNESGVILAEWPEHHRSQRAAAVLPRYQGMRVPSQA